MIGVVRRIRSFSDCFVSPDSIGNSYDVMKGLPALEKKGSVWGLPNYTLSETTEQRYDTSI